MLPFLGTLASGILGAGASIFGSMQGQETAQQQMAFQERMSSTAYQRASADMKAAGLNPMMMFGSGGPASTPPGAMNPNTAGFGQAGDILSKSVSTAFQSKLLDKTVDKVIEETAKAKADTIQSEATTRLREAQTAESKEMPAVRRQEVQTAINTAFKMGQEGRESKLRGDVTIARGPEFALTGETAQIIRQFMKNHPNIADTLTNSAWAGSKAGEALAPLLDILRTTSSARRAFQNRWPD